MILVFTIGSVPIETVWTSGSVWVSISRGVCVEFSFVGDFTKDECLDGLSELLSDFGLLLGGDDLSSNIKLSSKFATFLGVFLGVF